MPSPSVPASHVDLLEKLVAVERGMTEKEAAAFKQRTESDKPDGKK